MAESIIPVPRNGFQLAACEDGPGGDAPVILLSNSLGASHEMWQPQLAALTKHYRVLRYDTRGHGQSDAPPGPYSFDDLVADVIAVLDHFSVKQADFMGLSLGCMTGLGVALSHPDRLRKLIACDGRADAPPPFVQSWDDRIAAIESNGMQGILAGTMERWFTDATRDRVPQFMAQMDAMFLATSITGYRSCAEALKTLDYLKDLGDIRTPTLYVAGSLDFGAPPDVMREMAQATPGSTFVEIADAAHLANVDNPDDFNAAVIDFLK